MSIENEITATTNPLTISFGINSNGGVAGSGNLLMKN